MKLIQYKSKVLMALLAILVLGNCKQFDLDINEDPNNPLTTTPDLLLTNIQYSIADNMAAGPSDNAQGFLGMMTSGDDYLLPSGLYNNFWRNMYAGPLKDLEGIIAYADANGLPNYRGVANVLKAFVYVYMVDLFNDIPFSEASQGDSERAIKTPKFDKGQDIYAACITLLDNAIKDLAATSPTALKGDVMYNNSAAAWAKLARTLKMRMYLQTRLVDANASATGIKALIAENKMFAANSDDFRFQFSKLTLPDNRHPWYQATYAGENAFTYISQQLMIEMLAEKDPRFPFYFRRQTGQLLVQDDPTDRGTTPCATTPGCKYGYIVLNPAMYAQLDITSPTKADTVFLSGIFGRDRSDPAGVPADPALRTVPGVYPCGGYYDVRPGSLNDANGDGKNGDGAGVGNNAAPGGGIWPALSYFNLLYYQVEAGLAMGVAEAGDPRTNFEAAMRAQIKKVVDYSVATGGGSVAPAAAAIDAYVKLWLDRYDAASNNNTKLDIVMKQLWFSTWGNGYEIYNAYRRTGYPTTLQVELNPVRNFPFRLPYPEAETSLNPNAKALESIGLGYDKPENKVFWDKN